MRQSSGDADKNDRDYFKGDVGTKIKTSNILEQNKTKP